MAKDIPALIIADKNKKIYEVPFLEATGMKGGRFFRLDPGKLIKLHPDSELFFLPSRIPVGFDPETGEYIKVEKSPFKKSTQPCYAVAAFLSPGYTATYSASYREKGEPSILPLFSYAAVTFYKGEFYATGIRVDREKRQELAGMDQRLINENIGKFRRSFPKNRLIRHLERCALTYCCPAAKNFFLQRYEGPLPTSPKCNARCIGCISHQPGGRCPVTQPRIRFIPTPEEISQTALVHLNAVRDPVVSFGQGCEGEPLMAGETLVKAVDLIRRKTKKGIINLNTNASRPDIIKKLFDAGLDSIRVSLNSVQEDHYNAYYKPCGYSFRDVMRSIKEAKKAGGFVSINYLIMPGFTDSKGEFNALKRFLSRTNVDMIQWRNLNYDPIAYFKDLKIDIKPESMIGVENVIKGVHEEFPRLMKGYFNPSLGRMRRRERS